MILDSLRIPVADFEHGTGWAVKPEGACRGEICVPLPDSAVDSGGNVDVSIVATRLGMPIVTDEETGLSAIGPAALSGHALPTAVAPELELPDINGEMFRLSSLRGKKVVIISWAPY